MVNDVAGRHACSFVARVRCHRLRRRVCVGRLCAQGAAAQAPPHAAQTSGTLQVQGLHAPVTVTRDQWGIPHIVAANTDDLFFAQGFVQAQDRLFQMDLWKRSVQGRLSEVLGANFIQRDSMTRRIQFRGDLEREWASYGPRRAASPWRSPAESTHGSESPGAIRRRSLRWPDGSRNSGDLKIC